MKNQVVIKVILSSFLLLLLVSCANNPLASTSSSSNASVIELKGVPFPAGSQLDSKNSLIFGEGDAWSGKAEVNVPIKPEDAVKYFVNQYPSAGWTLLSSAKSKSSVLIFINKTKTLTVEISEGSSISTTTKVNITAAPISGTK